MSARVDLYILFYASGRFTMPVTNSMLEVFSSALVLVQTYKPHDPQPFILCGAYNIPILDQVLEDT